ncbi:MAG: DUF4835 family protein [Saprospiraceae bacterium]
MRFFSLLLILSSLSFLMHAQGELNSTVRINTPQLQNTDRKVFDQLEISLREFLNNTKWTKETFELEERIKCNFILTISEELGGNAYKGELAVQSVRPVYASSYDSPLISYLDRDVTFSYDQNQPIEFVLDATENQNLATLFAFYAYIIISLDYDSFSLYGGEPYIQTALQLVTNVQNSTNGAPGWRPQDSGKNRNRYWMVENLTSPRSKLIRSAYYTYHRKGLDIFTINMDEGKKTVLAALEEVDKVNNAYFNSMIVQMFANAKKEELVEMWKVGDRAQRDRVSQIMIKIDPVNTNRYREINF